MDVIDGKLVAEKVLGEVAEKVAELKGRGVVGVGDFFSEDCDACGVFS